MIEGVVPSVTEAARSQDAKAMLIALRENISWAIDEGVPARDLAPLSRRLMEINSEIERLEALAVDELERVSSDFVDAPFDYDSI